jgi:hypothetical protein
MRPICWHLWRTRHDRLCSACREIHHPRVIIPDHFLTTSAGITPRIDRGWTPASSLSSRIDRHSSGSHLGYRPRRPGGGPGRRVCRASCDLARYATTSRNPKTPAGLMEAYEGEGGKNDSTSTRW